LEGSLKRWEWRRSIFYQIHWPNPDEEIEEGWEALARFKEQGKVRWIGVSNFSTEQMKRAQKIAPSPACSRRTRCCGGQSKRRFYPMHRRMDRRDQLLAHGFRTTDRSHDGRAGGGFPGG